MLAGYTWLMGIMNCPMGISREEFHQVKLDPMMFFSFLFGSERFEPWIGELYVDLMIKVMARGATSVRGELLQLCHQKWP